MNEITMFERLADVPLEDKSMLLFVPGGTDKRNLAHALRMKAVNTRIIVHKTFGQTLRPLENVQILIDNLTYGYDPYSTKHAFHGWLELLSKIYPDVPIYILGLSKYGES